jgi:adenosylcobinamide-GDP ribazoletransferase
LFCALRFLTVLPLRWRQARDGEFFQTSVLAFPVAGLIIGLFGAGLAWPLSSVLRPSLLAWFAIFYLSGISGFLHLDGLADSADGLLSSHGREKTLAIMKDSRSGAMAVAVMVIIILGKFAALSPIASHPASLFSALIIAPLTGRVGICLTMAILPYARATEGGIGGLFYSSLARKAAAGGIALLVAAGFICYHLTIFKIIAASFAVTLLFAWFCKGKIGGATGDTLGAACELTELAALIACNLSFF